ncbi:hypothetical protein FQN49_000766 [Arthroderma sp. PD_2]|nr:hypothetical protein FQN49_000766 [Arthroderma sp. PD_2]
MASENGVDMPTMADRVQQLRARLSLLCSGASPSSLRNLNQPSRLQFPQVGIRIFAPRPGGSVRAERDIPPGRRSISSTGSVIDNNASPIDNIPPFPPSNSQSVNTMPVPETEQSRESQCNRGNAYIRWIQGSYGAWTRPKQVPNETSTMRKLLCLGPRKRARSTRRKLIDCAISGILLASVLTTYLVLAATSSGKKFEFHIILILAMMACTIFFCHSLIRLLMTAKRRPIRRAQRTHVPNMVERYTQIDRPIPIVVASDVEMGIGTEVEDDENKPKSITMPPPAYGLWRGSVKMDPNLLYWQRVDQHKLAHGHPQSVNEVRPSTANRPPSYISDDGIQSVVDSRPQQTPHTHHQQQPNYDAAASLVHPAERDAVKP